MRVSLETNPLMPNPAGAKVYALCILGVYLNSPVAWRVVAEDRFPDFFTSPQFFFYIGSEKLRRFAKFKCRHSLLFSVTSPIYPHSCCFCRPRCLHSSWLHRRLYLCGWYPTRKWPVFLSIVPLTTNCCWLYLYWYDICCGWCQISPLFFGKPQCHKPIYLRSSRLLSR